MENVRKHRDIRLATVNARKDYLVSETQKHTTTQHKLFRISISKRNEKNTYTHE